jgi:hypothetical protein
MLKRDTTQEPVSFVTLLLLPTAWPGEVRGNRREKHRQSSPFSALTMLKKGRLRLTLNYELFSHKEERDFHGQQRSNESHPPPRSRG